jgi:hypothetical protein
MVVRSLSIPTLGASVLVAVLLVVVSPISAELVNDPYVLTWADGAGAVAYQVAANTGVPEVYVLAYGSWSISFVGNDLHISLTVNPMTGTPQLQPLFAAGDLDWTPLPGTITGLVRDPTSPSAFFDLTTISLDGGVGGSSTTSLALANAGSEPSILEWIFTIQVEHPAPGDGNGDGKIDGLDYLIWAGNFGDDPAEDPPGPPDNGDFNGDGKVDGLDYLLWAGNFDMGPNDSVAVPEAASCALLILGTTMLLYFSRLKTEPPRAFCSGQTARCGSVLSRLGYITLP